MFYLTLDKGPTLIPNTLKLMALGIGTALLAGCASSPIPVSANFPITVEPKVRSAGHWNLLAADVVKQTLASLDKVGAAGNLHVALPTNATAFDKAFQQFLITDLVNAGRVVQVNPGNALEVSYQTQVVRHNSPRPHHIPGIYTQITAGLYAAYEVTRTGSAVGGVATGLAAAGLLDASSSEYSGGPTATELILTTTITSGGRYITRKTDIYYIEEADTTLLQYKAPQTVKVVGP